MGLISRRRRNSSQGFEVGSEASKGFLNINPLVCQPGEAKKQKKCGFLFFFLFGVVLGIKTKEKLVLGNFGSLTGCFGLQKIGVGTGKKGRRWCMDEGKQAATAQWLIEAKKKIRRSTDVERGKIYWLVQASWSTSCFPNPLGKEPLAEKPDPNGLGV